MVDYKNDLWQAPRRRRVVLIEMNRRLCVATILFVQPGNKTESTIQHRFFLDGVLGWGRGHLVRPVVVGVGVGGGGTPPFASGSLLSKGSVRSLVQRAALVRRRYSLPPVHFLASFLSSPQDSLPVSVPDARDRLDTLDGRSGAAVRRGMILSSVYFLSTGRAGLVSGRRRGIATELLWRIVLHCIVFTIVWHVAPLTCNRMKFSLLFFTLGTLTDGWGISNGL